jgi:hypothetical protein
MTGLIQAFALSAVLMLAASLACAAAPATPSLRTSSTVSGESAPKPAVKPPPEPPLVRLQTKQIRVGVTPGINLVLPDGDARVIIEHRADEKIFRVGSRYNFIFGKITNWFSFTTPVFIPEIPFEFGASDDIGYGRLYFNQRYLERARSGRVGTGVATRRGTLMTYVGRTSWRIAPFALPQSEDSGLIDSLDVNLTAGDIYPDFLDTVQPHETAVRFRHAFMGMGGDFHYDRLDANLSWLERGWRSRDRILYRAQLGEAYNIDPRLPLRETFALGGAGAVKGYRYEEFRGKGLEIACVEYRYAVPFSFEWERARFELQRTYLLACGEAGRIDESWFKPMTGVKPSAGAGIRLEIKVLDRYSGNACFYVAQAEGVRHRRPVLYFMTDLK